MTSIIVIIHKAQACLLITHAYPVSTNCIPKLVSNKLTIMLYLKSHTLFPFVVRGPRRDRKL